MAMSSPTELYVPSCPEMAQLQRDLGLPVQKGERIVEQLAKLMRRHYPSTFIRDSQREQDVLDRWEAARTRAAKALIGKAK